MPRSWESGVAYEQEGIMLTEHPLLDDSGDKTGHADRRKPDGKNGRDRRRCCRSGPPRRPRRCPRIRSCARCTRSAATSSAASKGLKLMKTGMEPARYAAELEKLLTELALKSQQIKDCEGKQ